AILDKLVTTTVSSQITSQDSTTETPSPDVESSEKVDDNFLKQLAQKQKTELNEQEPDEQELTEQVQAKGDSEDEKPREDILDQLTDGKTQDQVNNQENPKTPGETDNA
ncbi:MAG: hypothetical protein ACYTE8_12465, partial [Planctomycetota bacterium]